MKEFSAPCPYCKVPLTIGMDVTLPCSVWCTVCKENLVFTFDIENRWFKFEEIGSKAYGWLHGRREFNVH